MINRSENTVSVAMAAYNGEKYITEQINSILDNLSPYDELIISDDGSTDGTVEIIECFAALDNRIKLISGPRNGVKENFENAVMRCTKKYIFLSDQDDIWYSDKVEIVLKALISQNASVILHDAEIINGSGERIDKKTVFAYRNSEKGYLKNLVKNSYMGCCMAFSRDILPYILPIPKGVYMHDEWIGLLCDLRKAVSVLKQPLIYYRRHENNVTQIDSHDNLLKMTIKRLQYLFYTMKRYIETK